MRDEVILLTSIASVRILSFFEGDVLDIGCQPGCHIEVLCVTLLLRTSSQAN